MSMELLDRTINTPPPVVYNLGGVELVFWLPQHYGNYPLCSLQAISTYMIAPAGCGAPIVYLDCIEVKIRQDKQVINKAIHLAPGVTIEGQKELLELWLSDNEGAKFLLGVLTELQSCGVREVLIACVDGLKGFSDANAAVYPHTQIQLCGAYGAQLGEYVLWKTAKQ